MKEIPLTMGYVALVDDVDYERVACFKWRAQVAKYTVYGRRAMHNLVTGRWVETGLHRFIMDAPVGVEVDHKDHNGLHCWRDNLRLATVAQNRANSNINSNNTSGYKGVSWDTSKSRWRALIYLGDIKKHLGYYMKVEDAAAAYRAAELLYRGEFARDLQPAGQLTGHAPQRIAASVGELMERAKAVRP